MNKKIFWLSIIGIIISFAGGFLLANALNRNEINNLTAENERLKNEKVQTGQNNPESELTENEIEEKLAEAEKNPDNFNFQKGLGLGLYRYAMLRQDKALLNKVEKLLQRAYELNSDDYEVIVSLGNIYFDLGQINKDQNSNDKARKLYIEALAKNPKDINVRTDLGLTYLLTESPQVEKASDELEKSLEIDPKNERALQYMTETQIKQGNNKKASEYLAKLKEVNAQNSGIEDLEKQIGQTN
jgi:tetratricopeptide (TPR) repeat protein